jgi:hypothetical protein
MKPFNLEEAKAGKPVCTRDGRPVRIVDFNVKSKKYPILALIDNGGTEIPQTYKKDGKWSMKEEDGHDLFMKETEKHGWVNIIKNSSGVTSCSQNIWSTRKEAMIEATATLIITREDVIDTVRIKWKE